MTRKQIKAKIYANEIKIKALKQTNIELNRQNLLMSDKTQQYKEREETRGFGADKQSVIVGRIHWKEKFVDVDDDRNSVYIDRSRVVRVNSEWLDGL